MLWTSVASKETIVSWSHSQASDVVSHSLAIPSWRLTTRHHSISRLSCHADPQEALCMFLANDVAETGQWLTPNNPRRSHSPKRYREHPQPQRISHRRGTRGYQSCKLGPLPSECELGAIVLALHHTQCRPSAPSLFLFSVCFRTARGFLKPSFQSHRLASATWMYSVTESTTPLLRSMQSLVVSAFSKCDSTFRILHL
jgi:hypothetical protein